MTILIVDDKKENLYILEHLFKAKGYTVISAHNGAEALGLANKDTPDLILTDILMPIMDGYSLCRECKKHEVLKHVPFIFYTATYTNPKDEEFALSLGADKFVLKPQEPDVLLDIVKSFLHTTDRPMLRRAGTAEESETVILREYNQTLIRKLEDKMLQTEENERKLKNYVRELEENLEERKKIEEIVKQHEQQLASIYNTVGDVIYYVGVETGGIYRFLSVNTAFSKITGIPIDQIIGKQVNDVIPEPSLRMVLENYAAAIAGRATVRWEETSQYPNGTLTGIVSVSPVFDHEGQCTHLVGSVHDITERKRMEDHLRESELRFRTVWENVTDGMRLTNSDGIVVMANQGYSNIFGKPIEELEQQALTAVYETDRQNEIMDRYIERFRNRSFPPFREEELTLWNGKKVALEILSSMLEIPQYPTLELSVIRDVTEKKNLESQLFRSQRLDSLGTLAGGIAHDLNNVLSPIVLSLEVLKKSYTDEKHLKLLRAVESSARRGSEIVKQILLFARGVETKKTAMDSQQVLQEIISIFRETFPRSINIISEVPSHIPTVFCDPTHFHQMIMNLAVNARDAMPDGGTLTISAEQTTIDANYAKMNINAKPGAFVVITVKDTGSGMTKDVQERLFEPFFTTKEIGKGTGLGLSTVHTIVKSNRGFITVKSKPNYGSSFMVYLPIAETAEHSDQLRTVKNDLLGNGELILVVEDESSIAEAVKQTLEVSNYTVLTATDGVEAVVMFSKQKKNIALVITDIMMPLMDGHQLIVTLRKINPALKIIASSGMIERQKFDQDDIQGFLEKPYTSDVLLTTVRSVLQQPAKEE